MEGQELVCSGITKSVSDFLTLQSLLRHRSKLKQMFHSSEYVSSSYANGSLSISCVEILNDDEFWRAVEEIAAVSEPLLRVMRDVSGGKAAIGYIYESMTKVMDSIRTYYIMDEGKCKSFLDIVEQKWQVELHSPLHSAAAFLNPSIQYNPEVKFLSSIKEEFYSVLDKVLTAQDQRQGITLELHAFRKVQGLFASNIAKEARSNTSPGLSLVLNFALQILAEWLCILRPLSTSHINISAYNLVILVEDLAKSVYLLWTTTLFLFSLLLDVLFLLL